MTEANLVMAAASFFLLFIVVHTNIIIYSEWFQMANLHE